MNHQSHVYESIRGSHTRQGSKVENAWKHGPECEEHNPIYVYIYILYYVYHILYFTYYILYIVYYILYMYIWIYVYMYILYIIYYICIYEYMYICIYAYMYTCIYVYMYICIYVYMYICIYVFHKWLVMLAAANKTFRFSWVYQHPIPWLQDVHSYGEKPKPVLHSAAVHTANALSCHSKDLKIWPTHIMTVKGQKKNKERRDRKKHIFSSVAGNLLTHRVSPKI